MNHAIRLKEPDFHRRLKSFIETLWDEQRRDNMSRRWQRAGQNCGIDPNRLRKFYGGQAHPRGIESTQIELNAARVAALRAERRERKRARDRERVEAFERKLNAADFPDYGELVEGVRRAFEVD